MTRHYKIFLALGIIIFALPFLGISETWKITILFITGLILIIFGLTYRHFDKHDQDDSTHEETNGEELIVGEDLEIESVEEGDVTEEGVEESVEEVEEEESEESTEEDVEEGEDSERRRGDDNEEEVTENDDEEEVV